LAEQFGEKVHEATPHRRDEATKKGNIPKSQDLGSAIILALSTTALIWMGEYTLAELGPFIQEQLGGQPWVHASTSDALNIWVKTLWVLAWVTVPMFLILFCAAVAANVFQTGILFLPEKLKFDISRIDPLKGVGRLVSLQSSARVGFGLFKILVVFAVGAWALWSEQEEIFALGSLDIRQIAIYMVRTTLWLTFKIAIALLLLAIFDYYFQSWKFNQDLMMTEQEMREEVKQLNGNPLILQRRRQVQRQLANSRIASGVPQADATITNPTELAVSIKYDPKTMPAPIVVAKGAGSMAQRIRRLSLENNVPIIERKELAQALYRDVEVNKEIPLDQYNAVAEVLRYVYQLQGKKLPEMPKAA